MSTRTIPLRALQFTANVEMSAADQAGNVPVTVTARSGKPVTHWFWGSIVHDLSGFQAKPSIPLDYCHDPQQIVGFADKFDVSSGDLVVSGALTPFKDGDRASEIVAKKPRGVPYEASIFFDPYHLTVEEVPTGVTVTVNGNDCVGPLAIVRQWTLRGVAVCPYGTDSQTAVEFSSDPAAKSEVAVTIFTKDPAMPNATLTGKPTGNTAFDDKPKDDEEDKTKQDEDSKKECDCKGEKDCECDKEKTEQDDESDDKPKDDNAGKQSAKGPGSAFLSEFGEQGGVWFAQGKTIEQARTLFTQQLKDKNAALTKEVGELKARLKLGRGEANPASFSPPESEANKAAAEMAKKTGSTGLGAFAASIRIPGQN